LRHIQDVYKKHQKSLDQYEDFDVKCDRLCEVNVIEQVMNVVGTTVVQDAWDRGQTVSVHGWIYGLDNGLVNDLNIAIRDQQGSEAIYQQALSNVLDRTE
jgi:carbonic anhydrase